MIKFYYKKFILVVLVMILFTLSGCKPPEGGTKLTITNYYDYFWIVASLHGDDEHHDPVEGWIYRDILASVFVEEEDYNLVDVILYVRVEGHYTIVGYNDVKEFSSKITIFTDEGEGYGASRVNIMESHNAEFAKDIELTGYTVTGISGVVYLDDDDDDDDDDE